MPGFPNTSHSLMRLVELPFILESRETNRPTKKRFPTEVKTYPQAVPVMGITDLRISGWYTS